MKKRCLTLLLCILICSVQYAQSISDFPWLAAVLDTENCCLNNNALVYEYGSATYVYVAYDGECAGSGGVLYNEAGEEWCRDRSDLDCIQFYNLTLRANLFNCDQESDFDFFGKYPWLIQAVNLEDCCNNQQISAYRDANNHVYICVSGNPNCQTNADLWYYQNGDVFCTGAANYDCSEIYGFTDADIFASWDCSDNGDGGMSTFTVTIENIMVGRSYFSSGTTMGLLLPDTSLSISFDAGIGNYLSFATMFVQSNDLFIGPDQHGIALYDETGQAKTGDITEYIDLWDAGTELNEEPGVGPNQAPRQSGANTGGTENGTVQRLSNVNDGFSYPAVSELVSITLAHDGGTHFTLTINNISGSSSLPTPFAPGVWAIHSANQSPLFIEGNPASTGLENIAEDGDNSMMDAALMANSGLVSPFAPGAFAVNDPIFTIGHAPSPALEALAEDGSPAGFAQAFAVPVNGNSPAPIFPGGQYSFSFSAAQGDVLSFATMFVQSNDWFVGANDISLFSEGMAISGDITSLIGLYDAGTEVDEYSGAGLNQAPRQSGPNTGDIESSTVQIEATPGTHVPAVQNMVRVIISHN